MRAFETHCAIPLAHESQFRAFRNLPTSWTRPRVEAGNARLARGAHEKTAFENDGC